MVHEEGLLWCARISRLCIGSHKKSHIALNPFHNKLKPLQLYRRILDTINWRKVDNFRKEGLDRFVREVALQAEKVQTEHGGTPSTEFAREIRERIRSEVPVFGTKYISRGPSEPIHDRPRQTNIDVRGLKRKWHTPDAPLCSNLICRVQGKRHYISACNISDKKTKDNLLGEYRSNKKSRLKSVTMKVGNVARVTSTPTNPHFSLFKASFGIDEIKNDLMADQGADANFISSHTIKKI